MWFWVELKDHVPNGQTVTSLLRFNTFNTKQTYNESMSGGKGVAAVTTTIRVQKIVTVQDYIYGTTVTLVSCNRLAGSLLRFKVTYPLPLSQLF